jgi:predicted DNA-binding ribbon-helix-helix protein
MKSGVVKRSMSISGHKTSISLEEEFWKGLKEVGRARGMTLSALVAAIDQDRPDNLSSAVRIFIFNHFCTQNDPLSKDRHQDPHRADSIPYRGTTPD